MNRGLAAALTAAAVTLAMPLVMRSEGLSVMPYRDPVGLLTVCYGETHATMRRYTVAECRSMLAESLAAHGSAIAVCMPEHLPDGVQAAMLSFGYNVGSAKFCGSTMSAKLRQGDTPGACAELSKWINAGGNPLPGLVTRRAAERAMCEGRA